MGEAVAALSYVHGEGFVFGDVKPENLVITANGHVKLADFGACRPVSARARQVMKEQFLVDMLRTWCTIKCNYVVKLNLSANQIRYFLLKQGGNKILKSRYRPGKCISYRVVARVSMEN